MRCSICGTQNPEAAQFCVGCGARLGQATAAPGPGAHRLRIVPAGGTETRLVELVPGQYSMGRAPDCSIVLDDPYVSPLHLHLAAGATLRVQDAGSANGTFVRVRKPVQLRAGDELRMGRELLRLESLPAPAGAVGGGRVWGSPGVGHRFRLIQVLEGGGAGEILPLADGDYLIGRDEGGMTFPGDNALSGRHAILNVQGERASLRDMNSANGTFLRLTAGLELVPGDQLIAGMQQIRYEAA